MRMARLYAILGAVLAILEGGGMNTRKGFIREGFGLASILAAQSSPAILVRSMVAARGSFFGRGANGMDFGDITVLIKGEPTFSGALTNKYDSSDVIYFDNGFYKPTPESE